MDTFSAIRLFVIIVTVILLSIQWPNLSGDHAKNCALAPESSRIIIPIRAGN
ncbi:MAG: hypothetical protein K8R77_16465 [Anaerolineaceae bacterium]|nr:hypothetical protein [Anaerolineaceae bacterium]